MQKAKEKANEASQLHLNANHRKIINSVHQIEHGQQVANFKVIMEARAETLLMDEDSIKFNQHIQGIFPSDGIKYALSYIMKLISILLKEKINKDKYYKDILRALKKTIDKYSVTESTLVKKECAEIVREFQDQADTGTRGGGSKSFEGTERKTPGNGKQEETKGMSRVGDTPNEATP